MSARRPTTKPRNVRRPDVEVDHGFRWGRLNSLLLGAGLVTLVIGYVVLAKGSLTLAPALLVFAYVVLIPASLLIRAGSEAPGE